MSDQIVNEVFKSMEVIISKKYRTFRSRFKYAFKNLLISIVVAFALYAVFYGLSLTGIEIFCSLVVIAALYCAIISRTVLYRVGLSIDTRTVKVEILRFNNKHESVVALEDFKITIRKNYLNRYPPWVLRLYQNNKLLYKQEETTGWSYDDFLQIEQMFATIKKG